MRQEWQQPDGVTVRMWMLFQEHYPKLILTLDEEPEADYEGICRINTLDWLTEAAQ